MKSFTTWKGVRIHHKNIAMKQKCYTIGKLYIMHLKRKGYYFKHNNRHCFLTSHKV